MRDQRHRRVAALAIACAVGMGLVACSSDDRSAQETTQEQPAVDVTSAPAETQWVVGPAGLSYPVSDQAGPKEQGTVPHGFEPSPQGAVVAAIVSQVFMAGADDEAWPEVSQTLIEPGLGRNQWAQARGLMSVSDQPMDNPPVFKGFRVSDYSESDAVVTLAVEYPTVGLAAMPVQLSRASGDWKVVLPTQEDAPDLQELSAEDFDNSFTAFGPKEGM